MTGSQPVVSQAYPPRRLTVNRSVSPAFTGRDSWTSLPAASLPSNSAAQISAALCQTATRTPSPSRCSFLTAPETET